jgi:hypothetical protein
LRYSGGRGARQQRGDPRPGRAAPAPARLRRRARQQRRALLVVERQQAREQRAQRRRCGLLRQRLELGLQLVSGDRVEQPRDLLVRAEALHGDEGRERRDQLRLVVRVAVVAPWVVERDALGVLAREAPPRLLL